MIFPGTPGRFSDHDHAMRSNVGKGPKGDGIIADVVNDDPYGVYRVQFKNSRTGEVYLTTPNMDPGSRIYFCSLTLQYQSSEDVDVSYTVPLYAFSPQQVGTIRDARVGDIVFYKLRKEEVLGASAIGIGIITNLSLDDSVTFMQHDILDIENIDEIDAQVRRLQEDADNIEIALNAVQSTLDDLPSYNEFLGLSENVMQNESDITTKIPWPITPYSKYGIDGQVLRTNADGSTQWQNPVIPTDAQAETYINAWLSAHPEATTTVQDGVITTAKLANGVVTDAKLVQSGGVLDKVSELKSAIFDDQSRVIHDASISYTYSNKLNTEYVWILSDYFPQGSTPIVNVLGFNSIVGNSATVAFFKKNQNSTFTLLDSVELTIANGDNPVTIPSGITDDENVYVGFYSASNGLSYNGSGSRREPVTKINYSNIQDPEITSNGSANLDFAALIRYVLIDSYIEDLDNRVTALENNTEHSYIEDLDNRVTALENNTEHKKIVIVDASGNGDYETVIDAITTEPENTVITVKPGVYNQDMTSCLRKRIILIGTDRNQCIIRDTDGRYGHHPLYISCGYFENLTIEAPYVSGESQEIGVSDMGAYAVHIDTDEDYAIGKQCEFHHCTISSDFFPAVGLGMRKDAQYIFDDCELVNGQIANRGDYSDAGTLGALYFHDSNGEQGNQYIVVKNCILKSKLQYVMTPYQVNRTPQNNHVYCDFINNVLYSEINKYANTVWFRRNPFNPETGIFELVIGYGNSISSLNNN